MAYRVHYIPQISGGDADCGKRGTITIAAECICRPYGPRPPEGHDISETEALPLARMDIGNVFEEYREYALPQLGDDWMKIFPRIPPKTDELKAVLTRRLEIDEMIAIRQ